MWADACVWDWINNYKVICSANKLHTLIDVNTKTTKLSNYIITCYYILTYTNTNLNQQTFIETIFIVNNALEPQLPGVSYKSPIGGPKVVGRGRRCGRERLGITWLFEHFPVLIRWSSIFLMNLIMTIKLVF